MRQRTLQSRTVFEGRLLTLEVLEVETGPGTVGEREIVRHPGAVAVLARLPDGRFVFVRQFRTPIEQELLEIVAGKLEPGEDPEACARRELREETGYSPARVVSLAAVYNAPGYCDEKLHLFYMDLLPRQGAQDCDEGEHVDVVVLDRAEFEARMRRGEVVDAKTLAAWLLFEKKGLDTC